MPVTGPSLFRNPRALPALMLVGGLGVAGYSGWQWHEAPTFTEAEIEQSTEINLALDLGRLGPQLRPQGEKLEQLRAIVRAEVKADLARETHAAQQRFALGLIATVFGAGGMVFLTLSQRAAR